MNKFLVILLVSLVPVQAFATLSQTYDASANPITSMAAGAKRGLDVHSVGKLSAGIARHDYLASPVTSAAYVTLVASTASPVTEVCLHDYSGVVLVFAIGSAGNEVDQFYIPKGASGCQQLSISTGSRISIKAVSTSASTDEIDLSLFQ